jgi:hypothetical protein
MRLGFHKIGSLDPEIVPIKNNAHEEHEAKEEKGGAK